MNKLYKNWFIHDVIAHPVSYFLGFASLSAAKRVHDITFPESE